MATEIVFRVWCDPCLAEEVQTEGENLPALSLPGLRGRPRVLALCQVHRKEFYEPLLDLLREHGQQVDPEGKSEAPTVRAPRGEASEGEKLPCPTCGVLTAHRGSLAKHMRRAHDQSLKQIEREAGQLQLLPAAEGAGAEAETFPEGDGRFDCPECGKRLFSPQGKGAHRMKVHGVAGTSSGSAAYQRARAQTVG